jgi:hypothetical protein
VNLICDLATDVGKKVLVLGYDENLSWIRTIQDGVYADGELITLAQGAGTNSVNLFTSVTGIQFNEDRDGQVWLYEYNTNTAIKRMIGKYEAFETRPNYPKWYFPGVGQNSSNGTCCQTLVQSVVKLNYWPAKAPTDYLCIPCLPALKEMIMALNSAENEPDGLRKAALVTAGMASAKAVLNSQLQHFLGDGYVPSFEILGSSTGYMDPVLPVV